MSNKQKDTTMQPAEKHTLVPKRRFPEFRKAGKWEEKLLGDVCDMQSGKFVAASEISDKQAEGLYPCFGGNGLRGYTKTFNQSGRYSLIGRQGALCGNVNFVEGNFYATEHAVVTTPKPGIRTDWLFYNLCRLNLNRFATGQAQPGLSIDVLEKVQCAVPRDEKEQQKIADYFASLDKRITLKAKKLATLKTYKKGLMQQLFPEEGETLPKLRFPEFRDAGEWEIQPFKKLFTIGNGRDYKHLSPGNIPVYGSGGYMLSVDEHLYDGESVCIGRKGTINNPMFLTGKFWTVDTLFYTHSFNDCLPKFIYAVFQNIEWLKHNEAGGVPSLSKANIEKIEVAVPRRAEQQKIADCLALLDERITLESQKLDTLKIHKKGLMQQLFPTLDEVQE